MPLLWQSAVVSAALISLFTVSPNLGQQRLVVRLPCSRLGNALLSPGQHCPEVMLFLMAGCRRHTLPQTPDISRTQVHFGGFLPILHQ